MATKIEWADETWNPITGCSKISEGCRHCYAERMSKRLKGRFGYPADDPFRVTLHSDKLNIPLKWRKPRAVFVCSMGDLFHEDVPYEWIIKVWQAMYRAKLSTFMVLTKRPQRMADFLSQVKYGYKHPDHLPNVWLGVTAENQRQADKRISVLLQIPAAVQFVSVEPMLERVDLGLMGTIPHNTPYSLVYEKLGWVICGAETGLGARPMQLDWARDLRDQCKAASVPFFMKKVSPGTDTPPDLAIREHPAATQ